MRNPLGVSIRFTYSAVNPLGANYFSTRLLITLHMLYFVVVFLEWKTLVTQLSNTDMHDCYEQY